MSSTPFTILVADDIPLMRLMLTKYVKSAGGSILESQRLDRFAGFPGKPGRLGDESREHDRPVQQGDERGTVAAQLGRMGAGHRGGDRSCWHARRTQGAAGPQAINTRSITFVPVGPVRSSPPSAAKNP